MRLKIYFNDEKLALSNEKLLVNLDYRRYFISFIKSVFGEVKKYEELYSQKKVKPFVFASYLGKNFKVLENEKQKELQVSLPINIVFSTGDLETFSHFYNGLISLRTKNRGIKINGTEIPISNIYLEPVKKISSDSIVFKTLGICVINDQVKYNSNLDSYFLVPNHTENKKFNRVLSALTSKKYFLITGVAKQFELNLLPIETKSVYIKHYGGYLKGFRGKFRLEGEPNVLQFVYEYGLGIRTGQGFGLIEIENHE